MRASPSSSRRSAGWTTTAQPEVWTSAPSCRTTPCCGSLRDRSRATMRSLRTATGRRSRPTSQPSWPGEPIDPDAACEAPRWRRRRAPTCSSARAWAGFLVPLTPDYLVRDLARDLALPVVVVASTGPRHDQPHPADARGGACRRARDLRRGPHALARGPSAMERSNRETIERLGFVGSRRCRSLDLTDPSVLAGASHASRLAARDEQPARCLAPARAAGTASSTAASTGIAATASSAASCASTRLAREPRISRSETTSPATTTNAGQQHRAAERVDERRPRLLRRRRQRARGRSRCRAATGRSRPVAATPTDAPTMRDICRTPEATPDFCTLTAFIAAVDIGDITRAIPKPHQDERG